VGLFALLAAILAVSFGRVSDRGPRLFFSESLAVQEQEEVGECFVDLDQIVAQLAETRVAPHAEPPPEQLRHLAVI
jgi:hypothetical protein